jgi:hypothetical protein
MSKFLMDNYDVVLEWHPRLGGLKDYSHITFNGKLAEYRIKKQNNIYIENSDPPLMSEEIFQSQDLQKVKDKIEKHANILYKEYHGKEN